MGSQKTFHCVIHARLCYYQLKSQFAQKLKYLKDNSVSHISWRGQKRCQNNF